MPFLGMRQHLILQVDTCSHSSQNLLQATDDEIFASVQDELDAAVAGEASSNASHLGARWSEAMSFLYTWKEI